MRVAAHIKLDVANYLGRLAPWFLEHVWYNNRCSAV